MDERFDVDVEEPNQDLLTIPLEEAIEDYLLDAEDIRKLKAGEVVWWRDVALSMHREVEQEPEND